MRLHVLGIFLGATFAAGQTVSVGTASTVQTGSTTTITVPVTVSAGSSTTAVAAGALPILSVETITGTDVQTMGQRFGTLAMSNVVLDTANGWSAAANAYTIPTTGTYLIVSRIRLMDGAAAGTSYGQGVDQSRVDASYFLWSTTAGLRNSSMNVRLVKLTAGQTVGLYAYADASIGVYSAALTIQELN